MDDYTLLGLFVSAFVSSTLFPGGSEVMVIYMATKGNESLMQILWIATLGNTLGGMTSWLIGYWLSRRYPAQGLIKPGQQRALAWMQRWGSPVLLLSWLPVIGDPLCVVAGWLKIHWLISLLMILMGKAARYGVILYLVG